jgi:hypothetical protein
MGGKGEREPQQFSIWWLQTDLQCGSIAREKIAGGKRTKEGNGRGRILNIRQTTQGMGAANPKVT